MEKIKDKIIMNFLLKSNEKRPQIQIMYTILKLKIHKFLKVRRKVREYREQRKHLLIQQYLFSVNKTKGKI